MNAATETWLVNGPAYPRYFKIGRWWVSAYKVCLCVGVYIAVLVVAALADRAGYSPLRAGLAALACAIAGVAGARLYHLLLFAPQYWRQGSWAAIFDGERGGGSLFGGILPIALVAWASAGLVHIPQRVLWDYMAAGILFGSVWLRLGCIFNGCCAGRATRGRFHVFLHDTRGVRLPRVPVPLLEIAWWVVGWGVFFLLWPRAYPPGSYALGLLGWYGFARFWLEPWRERPDLIGGRWRVQQWVAALLVVGAGVTLARLR